MRIILALGVLTISFVGGGCGGDAQMELAAAEAIPQVADQIELAIDEYHRLAEAGYADREAAVVADYAERVARDPSAGIEQRKTLAAAMAQALAEIRADRETELQRMGRIRENLQTLRDMSATMRSVAIDSISLRDEARRYLHGWIDVLDRERTERKKEKASAAQQPGRVNWADAARAGVDRAFSVQRSAVSQ